MLYIGVDLGTSAVKLLMMDENGNIQKIVSKEYPLYFPKPGWSEQHPEDWYIKSMEGMKELTSECDKSQVAGISFGGQMHGLVALDKDDQVIRPAILWNDGRTGKQTEYLNQVIGKDKLSEYTANIAFAGFTAPKILWMKENEPENYKRIVKIMLPKDYLAYRLSGIFCTDVSDASGMLLMDVKNRCWSKEMLEICGIIEEQLPKLYESYEVVGTLKPDVANELGFSESVKVIAGAGDNAAAAVGTGTVGDGRCNISLGTSGTIFISSEKFGVDKHNALHSFAHADPQIIGALEMARKAGLALPVVYNTSGYEKPETIQMLDGYVDVYLPDFKYMEPELAASYSKAPDYPEYAKSSLKEMIRQTGNIQINKETGMIQKGVIVRHLVLPGHVKNSKAVIKYLLETYKQEDRTASLPDS